MKKDKLIRADRFDEMTYCPNCDYKDGFHISFMPDNVGSATVLLTCPSCHSRFKTAWKAHLSED